MRRELRTQIELAHRTERRIRAECVNAPIDCIEILCNRVCRRSARASGLLSPEDRSAKTSRVP